MNDKKIDDIINKLNHLTEDFNKFKNTIDDIIIMNTTLVQEIANQINTKMDILCNLETSSTTSTKDTDKNKKLKDLFDNYKKNMDNIYDDEEETKSEE